MLAEWTALPPDEADVLAVEIAADVAARQIGGGVVTNDPFKPDPSYAEQPKEPRVKRILGRDESDPEYVRPAAAPDERTAD